MSSLKKTAPNGPSSRYKYLHFSFRLCSHFHFDVIIISFPLIVTGPRASIYTHWLQGKKERKIWKSCCPKRTQTGSQTFSLRGQTEGKCDVRSSVTCASQFFQIKLFPLMCPTSDLFLNK